MRRGSAQGNGGEQREVIAFDRLDLDDAASRLGLVRAAVGIMNAGGGLVVAGADRNGRETGVDDATAERLSAVAVAALVDPFISPDTIQLDVQTRPLADARLVVEIEITEPAARPIVFTAPGAHQADDGAEVELFAAGSVVVAAGGRCRPAVRRDFRRWTASAVEAERSRLREQLSMVLEAPEGSRLRLLTADEVRDDPSYFLSRAADLFRQRPDRVLQTNDLQYLWLHRSSLHLDRTAAALLVQSALRKRATLFLWLAVLDLPPAELKAQLWAALEMRDRDKSDAARSILQVACLVGDGDEYRDLQQALAAADYTHMREAAEAWPAAGDARASLDMVADRGLRARGDTELFELADGVMASGGSAVLRQAPPIGLEVFRRKLERSVRA